MKSDISALKQRNFIHPPQSELENIWKKKLLNLKLAWQEYEQKKIILESRPFKAIVELTQNCNFKCIMCPQSWEAKFQKYDPKLNMPLPVFTRIAEEIFPTATFIDLRGFGESTILPYWPEIVDYLENYPFIEWYLVTNLGLNRPDTWEKMMKIGFTLGFSCDGATKETFESIRVNSNFKRIRENLGIIKNSIEKYNSGKIHFISTIQPKNIHELKQIVELAHEFSVPEVQFKVVQPNSGYKETLNQISESTIKEHVDVALNEALFLGVRVNFNDWLFTKNVDKEKVLRASQIQNPNPTPDPISQIEPIEDHLRLIQQASQVSLNQKCYKPYSYTYISYTGEMGTCNHMMYPRMKVMGDLNKQSVMEIWNSPSYQAFRTELISATPSDTRCQWCFKHRLED